MRRVLLVLLPLILVLPAAAGEADDLRAAFVKERAEGDLAGALELYRSAGKSADPGVRARARLGEARVLRRMSRAEEAREVLRALRDGGVPPDLAPEVEKELERVRTALGEKARLTELEAEVAGLRERLAREEGNRDELEREIAEKDELIGKLRDELSRDESEAAEREERLRRERESREFMAAYALDQARVLLRQGRRDEARTWVLRALEQAPDNGEARELLDRVGEAPGERERLVREVFRLLDEERSLRLDELRLQVDAVLAAGEDLLFRGELDAAAIRFTDCIALVDGNPSFARELTLRRERAEELLHRALDRGAARPPERHVEAAPTPESRWRETLRGLLEELAADSRPGGRRLSIYDLSALESAQEGQPPRPGVLSPSLRRPPVGDLLAALVPLIVLPATWSDGRQIVRAQGSSLVVHAPDEVQRGVRELLSRLGAGQDPPARLAITAVAVDPGVLAEAALAAGVSFRPGPQAASVVLEAGADARLRAELAREERGQELGRLEIDVPQGRTLGVELSRTLSLARPEEASARVEYGLDVALLPVWTGRDFGLSLAARMIQPAEGLLLPAQGGGELRIPTAVRQQIATAVRLPAGATFALAGLRNPFGARPFPVRSGLLLLVRVAGDEAPDAPGPAAPAPSGPVAVDLSGIDSGVPDEPAPPFRGERARVPETRSGFLLRYLRESLGAEALAAPGASLTVGRGVVRVSGGAPLVARVREIVEGLAATRDRLVGLRVRAAALTLAEEGRLLSGLSPGGTVLQGEGIRVYHLSGASGGEARRRVGFSVSGSRGRIPLPELLAARCTQLVSMARTTQWTFLREYRTAEDGERWPVYGTVDEGIAVEARPVIVPGDRVDATVSIRVARVFERGAPEMRPEGPVPETPVQVFRAATVRAVLAPEELLVVAGLPAPTPVVERRDRLVVVFDLP